MVADEQLRKSLEQANTNPHRHHSISCGDSCPHVARHNCANDNRDRNAIHASSSSGDYSNWYSTLDYGDGIAFFIRERLKHYDQVSNNLLVHFQTAVSELKREEGKLLPRIETWIGVNQLFFEKTSGHLQMGNTDVEADWKEEIRDGDRFNRLAEEYEPIIAQIIRNKVPSLFADNSIQSNIVISLTSGVLTNFLGSSDDAQAFGKKYDPAHYSGYSLVNDKTRDLDLKNALKVILDETELIGYLEELKRILKALNAKREPRWQSVRNIMNMIELETYDEKRKCCPTIWNLMSKIF
ncbi:MAG: hypothetical protein MN733_14800 [Nitrososphaera sp.]|nr:hypothetical protein [Nitrososphaera sp.]